ncbi:MAG: hypothetical protein HY017_14640 [Betaproteobacteria bacterium]|nr:hypothetical protein [Betaproteobacteria bacterium]
MSPDSASTHGFDAELDALKRESFFGGEGMLYGTAAAISLCALPVVVLSDWFSFNRVDIGRIGLIAIVLILSVTCYILSRLGYRKFAGGLLVVVLWIAITAFLAYTGIGLHSAVAFLYVPAIFFSALMLGLRSAAAQTALTVAVLTALWRAEEAGAIGGIHAFLASTTNLNFLLGVIASCVVTLAIAALFRRAVERAAERAVTEIEGQRRTLAELHLANARLEATEARLRSLNDTLEQHVAERTRDLMEKVRELELLSYSASHDLRSPLRAIAGFSAILRNEHGERLDGDARLLLERVGAAAERADELLNALLDLTHLGLRPLARLDVDVAALAERVSEELTGDRDHAVPIEIAPGLKAYADPRLLEILLQSLLANSVKFTQGKDRPVIRLLAAETTRGRAFCVEDNGAGFDPRFVDKLFKPFHRLHPESAFPGIGIGLAMARKIVERHGGEIWAEGRLGEGTAIFFTLPAPAKAN